MPQYCPFDCTNPMNEQMSELFDRDISTISRHIRNALKEELAGEATVANFATVQFEGEREVERKFEYYNLDMIIKEEDGIRYIPMKYDPK